MRKHKLKKFHRDYYIMLRKQAVSREQKAERALQEQFAWHRERSEGWSAPQHVERTLNLARRGGFYIDILKTRGGLKEE